MAEQIREGVSFFVSDRQTAPINYINHYHHHHHHPYHCHHHHKFHHHYHQLPETGCPGGQIEIRSFIFGSRLDELHFHNQPTKKDH